MSEPETTDEASDADDETVADAIAEVDVGLQARLWLRALVPVLQLRTTESESCPAPSPRVLYALDEVLIAGCERAARILRSDLSGGDTHAS